MILRLCRLRCSFAQTEKSGKLSCRRSLIAQQNIRPVPPLVQYRVRAPDKFRCLPAQPFAGVQHCKSFLQGAHQLIKDDRGKIRCVFVRDDLPVGKRIGEPLLQIAPKVCQCIFDTGVFAVTLPQKVDAPNERVVQNIKQRHQRRDDVRCALDNDLRDHTEDRQKCLFDIGCGGYDCFADRPCELAQDRQDARRDGEFDKSSREGAERLCQHHQCTGQRQKSGSDRGELPDQIAASKHGRHNAHHGDHAGQRLLPVQARKPFQCRGQQKQRRRHAHARQRNGPQLH